MIHPNTRALFIRDTLCMQALPPLDRHFVPHTQNGLLDALPGGAETGETCGASVDGYLQGGGAADGVLAQFGGSGGDSGGNGVHGLRVRNRKLRAQTGILSEGQWMDTLLMYLYTWFINIFVC